MYIKQFYRCMFGYKVSRICQTCFIADYPNALSRSQPYVTSENMAAYAWLQLQYQHQHQNRAVSSRNGLRYEPAALNGCAPVMMQVAAAEAQPAKKTSIWSPGNDIEKLATASKKSPTPDDFHVADVKPSLTPPETPVDNGKTSTCRKLLAPDRPMQPWDHLAPTKYRFGIYVVIEPDCMLASLGRRKIEACAHWVVFSRDGWRQFNGF
jgi:hypothetical protein